MITALQIETELRKILPPEYKEQSARLADIVAAAVLGRNFGTTSATLDAATAATLPRLANQTVDIQGQQVHFGSDNQFGNIEVGPVVGGDMLNVTLMVEQPSKAGRVLVPLNVRPRIFISHHADEEPATKDLMEQLREKLESQGYKVVIDKDRLLRDATWQNDLYTWMGLSHAAITLISNAALKSDWVRREASVLTARPSVESEFTLVPVVLDSVDLADLEKGSFDGYGLARFKPIEITELEKRGEDPVEAIVAAVTSKLKNPQGKPKMPYATNLEKLEEQIVTHLSDIPDNQKTKLYARVAAQLGLDYSVLSSFADADTVIVRTLWQAKLEDMIRSLKELHPGFRSEDAYKELVQMFLPIWVDPCAARWIPGVAKRQTDRRILGLNAHEPNVTGFHYVYRAFSSSKRQALPLAPITLSDVYDIDATIREIRLSLKTYVYGGLNLTDARLEALLKAPGLEMPPIVIIGGPMPDRQMLGEITEAFKKTEVTFFLLHGDIGGEMAPLDDSIQYLRPFLGPGEEDVAINYWTQF